VTRDGVRFCRHCGKSELVAHPGHRFVPDEQPEDVGNTVAGGDHQPPSTNQDPPQDAAGTAVRDAGPSASPGRELEDLVAAVESAPDLSAALEVLRDRPPPPTAMDRALLRERLMKSLKAKGSTAPARLLDAWEHEAEERVPEGPFLEAPPEPHPGPVDGALLLEDLAQLFERFVYTGAEAIDALALWAAWTWFFDVFGVSPLLAVTSPTMRCGKSSVLSVLLHAARWPLASSNITPSALFRVVEAYRPTLLIDEADTFVGLSEEFRGLLNAGWTRDAAYTLRTEGDRVREVRRFSTWCPKAVAAIGDLPPTVMDRAIRIRLRRKPKHVRRQSAFEPGAIARAAGDIPNRLARWAIDAAFDVRAAEPPIPTELDDRARENWRPLLAVAEVAGGHWPERARRAALELSGEEHDEELGVLLLRHIREIFREQGDPEGIATDDLLHGLVRRDDGPWAGWWADSLEAGKTKSPAAKLAKRLRVFGIASEQLWIEGRNRRGYARRSLEEHWAAYLDERAAPEDARDARDARPQLDGHAGAGDTDGRAR